MEFKKGQFIEWVHGEHHRVAYILKVTDELLLIDGMTKSYWVSKSAMEKKVTKAYPRAGIA